MTWKTPTIAAFINISVETSPKVDGKIKENTC